MKKEKNPTEFLPCGILYALEERKRDMREDRTVGGQEDESDSKAGREIPAF